MTPKSENILKVINNFKKVLPKAVRSLCHLNMRISNVNVDHVCGTTHCHGGWYAVAACDLRKCLSYNDGVEAMAKHLGFEKQDEILCWADDNPEIWGNDYGSGMFSSEKAFFHPIKRRFGAENLQHIIDHWTEVYVRVLAIELEEKKTLLLSVPPVDSLIEKAMEIKPQTVKI